jgi:hypothetical protein
MKTKKPKPIPIRRRTLAGQIRTLAQTDIVAAELLAFRGQQFSEIETLLANYYDVLGKFQTLKSCGDSETQKPSGNSRVCSKGVAGAIREFTERDRMKLCRIFIRAVDSRDSKKIIEIAEAVEFLKSFKASGDRLRHDILALKNILDRCRVRCPIRDVAEFVNWPDMKSQDGFSRLRRLCAELKFPLATSR